MGEAIFSTGVRSLSELLTPTVPVMQTSSPASRKARQPECRQAGTSAGKPVQMHKLTTNIVEELSGTLLHAPRTGLKGNMDPLFGRDPSKNFQIPKFSNPKFSGSK
jgi:hypothetical protein